MECLAALTQYEITAATPSITAHSIPYLNRNKSCERKPKPSAYAEAEVEADRPNVGQAAVLQTAPGYLNIGDKPTKDI